MVFTTMTHRKEQEKYKKMYVSLFKWIYNKELIDLDLVLWIQS